MSAFTRQPRAGQPSGGLYFPSASGTEIREWQRGHVKSMRSTYGRSDEVRMTEPCTHSIWPILSDFKSLIGVVTILPNWSSCSLMRSRRRARRSAVCNGSGVTGQRESSSSCTR